MDTATDSEVSTITNGAQLASPVPAAPTGLLTRLILTYSQTERSGLCSLP